MLQDYIWEGRFPSCLKQHNFKSKLPVNCHWVSAVAQMTVGQDKVFFLLEGKAPFGKFGSNFCSQFAKCKSGRFVTIYSY